jgi:atypical dual specificity phosphatase
MSPSHKPSFKLSSIPARPIVNSYWATPNLRKPTLLPLTRSSTLLVVACEYPHSPSLPIPKIDALLEAGIRTFIDLTEPNELVPYDALLTERATIIGLPQEEIDRIEYHRFAIKDRCIPPSPHLLEEALAVLEDCERRGRKAAVHCRGGVGRTGTIVGCWLIQSGLARNGKEALRYIDREWRQVEKSKRFPRSPETGQQEEYVRRFKRINSRDPSPLSDAFSPPSTTV